MTARDETGLRGAGMSSPTKHTNQGEKVAENPTATAANAMPEFGCNGCTNRWGGFRTCHCGACHETFTGEAAFIRHRVDGKCHDPRVLKHGNDSRYAGKPLMVDAGRSYPCWANYSEGEWTGPEAGVA